MPPLSSSSSPSYTLRYGRACGTRREIQDTRAVYNRESKEARKKKSPRHLWPSLGLDTRKEACPFQGDSRDLDSRRLAPR